MKKKNHLESYGGGGGNTEFYELIEIPSYVCHHLWKEGVSAKSIDSGQPAQFAQADLSRYFLLLINFLHITRKSKPHIARSSKPFIG